MDALVTDVHLPSGVAGMRGLGRAGYQLVALGDRWSAGGLWSRYATRREVGPTAVEDPVGFAATIERLAAAFGPLVVYPGWDASIPAVLDQSTPPQRVVSPYPDTAPAVVHRLRDKRQLPAVASLGGLTVPSTLAEGSADAIADAAIRFPCVLKPVRSGGQPSTAQAVESKEALAQLLEDIDPTTELLIQDFVRGKLVMLTVILDRDRVPVASFQQVSSRVWPSEAGGASVAVSVAADPRLVRAVSTMLAAAGFSGMAQLDFIESDYGRLLIDINPRYYTSMPLALACGVNLSAIWHAVVLDEHIPQRCYRTGVSFRWLEADMRAAVNGAPELLLQRTRGRRVGAMWAWDDPIPGPLLFARATQQRWAKLFGLDGASAA